MYAEFVVQLKLILRGANLATTRALIYAIVVELSLVTRTLH